MTMPAPGDDPLLDDNEGAGPDAVDTVDSDADNAPAEGSVDEQFLQALVELKTQVVELCQHQLDNGADGESMDIARDTLADEVGEIAVLTNALAGKGYMPDDDDDDENATISDIHNDGQGNGDEGNLDNVD